MKIIWDEPKRIANFQKHGLDFADVVDFEWETAVIDATYSSRMKAIGFFADGTAVVIFATLGVEAISIISFRPASAKERKVLNGY
ncbi:BrnT family toxin [Rhizobium herbae]